MKNSTRKEKVGGGVLGNGFMLLAGAAALAAGSYFFAPKKGAKRREHFRAWSVKAKGDVLEKIEGLKHIDSDTYAEIVDSVVAQYKGMKKATPAELALFAGELKSHWKRIVKEANVAAKPAKKAGKKVAKKK